MGARPEGEPGQATSSTRRHRRRQSLAAPCMENEADLSALTAHTEEAREATINIRVRSEFSSGFVHLLCPLGTSLPKRSQLAHDQLSTSSYGHVLPICPNRSFRARRTTQTSLNQSQCWGFSPSALFLPRVLSGEDKTRAPGGQQME